MFVWQKTSEFKNLRQYQEKFKIIEEIRNFCLYWPIFFKYAKEKTVSYLDMNIEKKFISFFAHFFYNAKGETVWYTEMDTVQNSIWLRFGY